MDKIPTDLDSLKLLQKHIDKTKILVVDDEKFNCEIIYGFLMILGFKNR